MPTTRRTVLLAAAGFPAALVLPFVSGCGFELRRAPEMRFRTIQLSGFKPRSPLAEELRMNINGSTTTKVVETAAQAQVVLEAIDDVREKSVVASTAVGQVTEFQLRARFKFRVRGAGGKEQEEAFLYRALQSDIVAQVLRRLASIQNF